MPEADGARFRFGAVLLAAGGSSRMGVPKQLLMLGGATLVSQAVDAALASAARPVVVVLGASCELVAAAISGKPVVAAFNADWRSGMASSIRTGLEALLEAEPNLDALAVCPCDQPALSGDVIDALARLHRATGSIAAARFCGRNAAPAVFGRGHFGSLRALSGDSGARTLLNSGIERVASLELPDFALDVDTPADMERWGTIHHHSGGSKNHK